MNANLLFLTNAMTRIRKKWSQQLTRSQVQRPCNKYHLLICAGNSVVQSWTKVSLSLWSQNSLAVQCEWNPIRVSSSVMCNWSRSSGVPIHRRMTDNRGPHANGSWWRTQLKEPLITAWLIKRRVRIRVWGGLVFINAVTRQLPCTRSREWLSFSRTSQHFMELEGLLPC
jgi:hypothetical protein